MAGGDAEREGGCRGALSIEDWGIMVARLRSLVSNESWLLEVA